MKNHHVLILSAVIIFYGQLVIAAPTIRYLQFPAGSKQDSQLTLPLTLDLPCYGHVQVTTNPSPIQSASKGITFFHQDAAENKQADNNPAIAWGADTDRFNVLADGVTDYTITFTFLDGPPDASRLFLVVAGLAFGSGEGLGTTTAMVSTSPASQPGSLAEYKLPGTSTTVLTGSTLSSKGDGVDKVNTGWALYQTQPNAVFSSLSVVMHQIGGDGVGWTLAYNCAFVEICKSSSLTDPVTGNFTFTATNGTFTSPPVVVPVGVCSGPVPVRAGTVKITEAPTSGVGLSAITAYGYNPVTNLEENRLVSSDLANRAALINAPAGTIAAETIVDFTNLKIPTGILEVCKDAAPGTTVTGNFSFTVSGAANNPYLIPVGACSGPILVQAGSVTVTESPRAGFSLIDVATIPGNRLVSINLPAGSAVVTVNAGDVTSETVVRFINTPASTATGQLKICKVAGAGVLQGQNFTITANGVSYTVPAGPAVTGGFCVVDGTFSVGTPVTVQETPPAPYQVLNMTVNPPNRSIGSPILANGNGQVTVAIDTGFTEVTVTNIGSTPTGQLKICKIAGPNVAVGTNFAFSVTGASGAGTTQSYSVPAGPSNLGGYCVVDGTIPVGTYITVTEIPTAGYFSSSITVNGTPLPAGTPSASITIGSGINEVAFTNSCCTVSAPSSFLHIDNYELVGRQAAEGPRAYLTYRAALLNTGTALQSVIATATSLDPSNLQVVPGRDAVMFVPVPANSEVASSNTFTILADPAVPPDFSRLKWTLRTEGGPARRRAVR